MKVTIVVCTAALISAAVACAQQKPLTPSSPASEQAPVWSRAVKLPDGRTFVTDGGLAIDTAIAKPPQMPETVLGPQSGAQLARYFTVPYDDHVDFGDLRLGQLKNTCTTPKGVVLNGNYVNYLRGILPA